MKRTFLTGVALAAGLAAFGGPASAASLTPAISAAMPAAASEDAGLITVGMRFKRQKFRAYRSGMHRSRPNRARRFGSARRPSAMWPYIPTGVVSGLIRRRQCLDALFPQSDPACR